MNKVHEELKARIKILQDKLSRVHEKIDKLNEVRTAHRPVICHHPPGPTLGRKQQMMNGPFATSPTSMSISKKKTHHRHLK